MGNSPSSPPGNIAAEPELPRSQPQPKTQQAPRSEPRVPQAQPISDNHIVSPKPDNPQVVTSEPSKPQESFQPENPQVASKPDNPQAVISEPSKSQESFQPENPQVASKSNNPQAVSVQPKKYHGASSQPFKPHDVQLTAKDKEIAEEIMGRFDVQKMMKEKLNSVAHTPDQLEYIVNEIVKAVFNLEQGQTTKEKDLVPQVLNEIKLKEFYFHNVVKRFKSQTKLDPKPETLSRIYYEMANLRKNKKVDTQNNYKGIIEKTSNDYEKLSEVQVDQVVKYQAISEKILELGTKLNFKFNSIERDSNGTIRLLAEISSSYQEEIQGFKYDLSPQEFKKAAQISRNACNHHDNGVVLLFIYFVRSCRKLQKDGESVSSIEKKLDQTIKWISKEYPPGQGLDSGKKHLEGVLKNLQHEDKFSHQPSELNNSGDKQAQLENIILYNANVAKRNRDNFQELIRQACFKHAIQTKVGLKLNPDHPNKKAMIRIKEKMLFGKAQNLDKKAKDTIQDTIESEDRDYKEAIDRLLKEKDEVTFKISDMVRGKCVFLQVEDIILTVNQIKEFVRNDPRRRFRITEIESRFTNPQPISDVTLKIAINEEIVSQLQLTIQANAAAYNFAHKVYELARTKVFSKVKISHNYFEEFAGDFKAQTSRALDIAKRESKKKDKDEEIGGKEADLKDKYGILAKQTATISKLLDLQSMETPMSYEDVLTKSIAEQRGGVEGLAVSIEQKLQKLMVTLFRKQMGSWKRELGRDINYLLQSEEHPPLLKSTLLSYFYQSFDISKQITPMLHFYPNYKEALEKMGKNEEKAKEDYMEMYLQQVFGIEKPFSNIQSTARLFYKAQQLQQITISKESPYVPSELVVKKIIKGVILEENSPDIVDFLSQLLLSFFMVRGEKQNISLVFNNYYLYLMSIIDQYPRLVPKLASCSPKFLKAQQLLEGKNHKQAKTILEQIIVIFKENEEIEQELQCELLLAECKANTDDFNQFKEYYAKNVIKKAEALGIELRGVAVANSEFRIYQKLWEKKPSAEEKELIVKTHLNKAMLESSKSEGEEWLYKMVKSERQGHHIDDQCIRENRTVNYVNVSYNYEIYGKHMVHLQRSSWPELSAFYCIKRNLSEKGCEYISKADFKNLSILDLWDNNIGAEGCEHLSKADWKNLSSLNLEGNSIDAEACGHLSKANWKSLSYLRLNSNKLTDEGLQALAKADWPMLSTLKLNNCEVSDAACRHISKANWKSLSILDLVSNKIGDKGCEHLGRADWKSLSSLDLEENKVGPEGFQHLAKANFKSLYIFNINNNEICDKGCEHLAKSNWKKLSSLSLMNNSIGAKGCEHLSKADWQHLSKVNLSGNKLGAEGCKHLNKAIWKKLSSLDLTGNQINNQERLVLKELWKQKYPNVHVAGL